ncbi:MAG: CRISPR-associated endonuclease Cas3'', partial [Pseudomonadota bacterium]|nr:CRISPR-associated endonuclease Cas3'' [Pseudomonadota bacterium]
MKYYAHSSPEESKADWQLLSSHLQKVGELAAQKSSHFGGQGLAEISGLLHDLGKYCAEFQARLEGSPKKVDHATWGARIALEKYGPNVGHLLAYGIAGHHAGLADGAEEVSGQAITSLAGRLQAEPATQLDPIWKDEIALPGSPSLPGLTLDPKNRSYGLFQLSVLGRMLYSCLVDADFIDTD